ncbi:MAG: hypothetical protein JOS17DRAFT_306571 [Linnemannia elongata]|nr:MAG: hypothetical protein JOS17DRAFT_306571 [Linnemannia elongata]
MHHEHCTSNHCTYPCCCPPTPSLLLSLSLSPFLPSLSGQRLLQPSVPCPTSCCMRCYVPWSLAFAFLHVNLGGFFSLPLPCANILHSLMLLFPFLFYSVILSFFFFALLVDRLLSSSTFVVNINPSAQRARQESKASSTFYFIFFISVTPPFLLSAFFHPY